MRPVGASAGAHQPAAVPKPSAVAIPRGRPTPERAAAIDAAIREAALEVFLAAGFDAATMELVAQRAQVSKGTLYARFESKAQLFRAIIEDELVRWSRRAGENDHLLPTEFGARLRHHAQVLVDVYSWPEYRRFTTLIEGALATMPGLARDWEELGANRYLQFLAEDMAKTAGAVTADWNFLAGLFLFSISGRQRNASAEPPADEATLADFADQVVAIIELAVSEAPPRR
jgi:AcrR family transcriptional regulator